MKRRRPTVVLSLANVLSMGALRAAGEMGLRVGQDVAFAGFDDFPGADTARPAVTVLEVPIRQLAETCAAIACGSAGAKGRRIVLKAKLVRRGSLGTWAQAAGG